MPRKTRRIGPKGAVLTAEGSKKRTEVDEVRPPHRVRAGTPIKLDPSMLPEWVVKEANLPRN